MPQAALGPIIGGVASLGGALLGNRAQKKATEASTQANREALAYQKEQEAARRAQWNQAMQIWDQNRRALLQRYGVEVPGAAGPAAAAPAGMAPGAVPGGGPMAAGSVGYRPTAGPPAAMPRLAEGSPGTLGEILSSQGASPDMTGGWRRGRYGIS